MLSKLSKGYRSLIRVLKNADKIDKLHDTLLFDAKSAKVNLGQLQRVLNRQLAKIKSLEEVEFQVFSQGGEDGIIQYLVDKLDIKQKTFIEFGVENYKESNTRFLFLNNNWSGYIIDGDEKNINYVDHEIAGVGELFLEAAFITRDNIDELLRKPGFDREIGLLSIDIDGNDYWVWEKIDSIEPVIVVAEYNAVFGKNTFWSVPYDPAFVRSAKHDSLLYYGVSLQALCFLAERKGYAFIGCNSRGNNAFFVRKDYPVDFLSLPSVEEGYRVSRFREARNAKGWITGKERIKVIEGLDVVDVRTGENLKIDARLVQY